MAMTHESVNRLKLTACLILHRQHYIKSMKLGQRLERKIQSLMEPHVLDAQNTWKERLLNLNLG